MNLSRGIVICRIFLPCWNRPKHPRPDEIERKRPPVSPPRDPCNATLVLRVPMYSVCSRTILVFRTLAANVLAFSSFASRMPCIAFNLQPRTLNLSSMVSLLTIMSYRVVMSVVSREIVRVATVFRGSGVGELISLRIRCIFFLDRA